MTADCGAYGVRQHAPGRGAGREVLKFVNAGVLKLGKSVLFVLGVYERAARVWDTAGELCELIGAIVRDLERLLLICHGV